APSEAMFSAGIMTLNIDRMALFAPTPAPAPAPAPTFTPLLLATPMMMTAALPTATASPSPAPASAPALSTRTTLATGSTLSSGTFLSSNVLSAASFLPPKSISSIALERDVTRYTALDVRRQIPVAGLVERTVSVAERLKPQPAVQALQYAIASKAAVVRTLAGLAGASAGRPQGIALGDIPMAGFRHAADGDKEPSKVRVPTLDELLADQARAEASRQFVDDDTLPASQQGKHEAEYFSAAVEAIDNSIAIMRLVEGRVALFEELAASLTELKDGILSSADEAAVYL